MASPAVVVREHDNVVDVAVSGEEHVGPLLRVDVTVVVTFLVPTN
jgi:hypothetical protein